MLLGMSKKRTFLKHLLYAGRKWTFTQNTCPKSRVKIKILKLLRCLWVLKPLCPFFKESLFNPYQGRNKLKPHVITGLERIA